MIWEGLGIALGGQEPSPLWGGLLAEGGSPMPEAFPLVSTVDSQGMRF